MHFKEIIYNKVANCKVKKASENKAKTKKVSDPVNLRQFYGSKL